MHQKNTCVWEIELRDQNLLFSLGSIINILAKAGGVYMKYYGSKTVCTLMMNNIFIWVLENYEGSGGNFNLKLLMFCINHVFNTLHNDDYHGYI